jgi:hypothetical protein
MRGRGEQGGKKFRRGDHPQEENWPSTAYTPSPPNAADFPKMDNFLFRVARTEI